MVFCNIFLYKLNKFIFRLSLRGIGILNYENKNVSGEHHFLTKKLFHYLKKDNLVLFDVGANVGEYAITLSNQFPKSKIFTFEPHPINFQHLIENTSNYSNLIHNEIALSNEIGNFTLYDKADSDGSEHASIYEDVIKDIHHSNTIAYNVKVDTIDNYCLSNDIKYIDFIKIDTEGNDLGVLEGAKNMLQNGNIGLIHFEFNEMNIVSKAFLRDFKKILPNYTFYRLLPKGMVKIDESPIFSEIFAYQNIIAFKN